MSDRHRRDFSVIGEKALSFVSHLFRLDRLEIQNGIRQIWIRSTPSPDQESEEMIKKKRKEWNEEERNGQEELNTEREVSGGQK